MHGIGNPGSSGSGELRASARSSSSRPRPLPIPPLSNHHDSIFANLEKVTFPHCVPVTLSHHQDIGPQVLPLPPPLSSCFLPLGPTSHCALLALPGFPPKPPDPCQRDGLSAPWSLNCSGPNGSLHLPCDVPLACISGGGAQAPIQGTIRPHGILVLLEKGTFSSRQFTSTVGKSLR